MSSHRTLKAEHERKEKELGVRESERGGKKTIIETSNIQILWPRQRVTYIPSTPYLSSLSFPTIFYL